MAGVAIMGAIGGISAAVGAAKVVGCPIYNKQRKKLDWWSAKCDKVFRRRPLMRKYCKAPLWWTDMACNPQDINMWKKINVYKDSKDPQWLAIINSQFPVLTLGDVKEAIDTAQKIKNAVE